MNNNTRKELKVMLENEIFFYNANVKKYNYYKDSTCSSDDIAEKYLGRCAVAEKLCEKYSHSCYCLIKMLNLCDSKFNYSLKFENLDFYSPCRLVVEKVEG